MKKKPLRDAVKTKKIQPLEKKVSKAVINRKFQSRVGKKVVFQEKSSFSFQPVCSLLEKDQPFPAMDVGNQPKYQTEDKYSLPVKYGDDRIVLLPRDPWWLYTYWDISQERIDRVIAAIDFSERTDLKWILRVYDVTGVSGFNGGNAYSFFDLDIGFEAGNWYMNVNPPGRDWCVEIGLKNSAGRFFAVARSNIVKSPCFGISSNIDEEWVLPEEEYFKVLGIYDLGRSSLERKRKFEELMKHQLSSPLASGGISSLFSMPKDSQDKFFLEVATELILYGRTEPDAHVTLEGKKIKLRKDGTFSFRYFLPEGDYKFEVIGTSKNKKYTIKKVPAVKRFNK